MEIGKNAFNELYIIFLEEQAKTSSTQEKI